MNKSEAPPIFVWVLALGATGFLAGFFGPMILNPQANQGPLLGLLITGPLGAAAGAVLGLLFKFLPVAPKHKTASLFALCGIGGIAVLYFCLPEPKVLAYIVDGSVTACNKPSERMEQAIKDWEQRVANFTSSKPREGWKEDTQRMLREAGVVLTVDVARQATLLEHRKPWDFGRIAASSWIAKPESRPYFARFADSECSAYDKVEFPLYVATGQGSSTWPPSELSNFLNLAVIEPVPARYRPLLQ